MIKYYTKACNFYFGLISKKKVKSKFSLPLHGNNLVSFDTIEILSRKKIKRINIKDINRLENKIKKKVLLDIKKITKKNLLKVLNFQNFLFLWEF